MAEEWAELTSGEFPLSRAELKLDSNSWPPSPISDRNSDGLSLSTPTQQVPFEKDVLAVESSQGPCADVMLESFKQPPMSFGTAPFQSDVPALNGTGIEKTAAVVEKRRPKCMNFGKLRTQTTFRPATTDVALADKTRDDVTVAKEIVSGSGRKKARSQKRNKPRSKVAADKVEMGVEMSAQKVTVGKEVPKSNGDQNAQSNKFEGITRSLGAVDARHPSHSSKPTAISQNREVNSPIGVLDTVVTERRGSICERPSAQAAGDKAHEQPVESLIQQLIATRPPILSRSLCAGRYGPEELELRRVPGEDALKLAAPEAKEPEPELQTKTNEATSANHSGAKSVGAAVTCSPDHLHANGPCAAVSVKLANNICGRYATFFCSIL